MNFARGKLRIGVLGAVTDVPSIFNEEVENEQIEGGHTGVSEVREIQQALKTRHYDPGPIDGFWGPKTCAAMLRFQKAKFGSAKQKFLDYDTFLALGFDVQRADHYASRYGLVCGGTVEPPSAYGPGTEPVVSVADVKKIQRAINNKVSAGIKVDGVWGPKTCQALFAVQKKATGSNSNLLLAGTFKSLGFDSTKSMLYAQSFGQVCGPWWRAEEYIEVTPKKPTGGGGGGTTPTEPESTPEPVKAGFGTWLAVGLGLTIIGTALFGEKQSKKRGSYVR